MSDTVKSWIEERRAIIHGAREAIRPAEAIDLGLIDLPRALDALNAVLELHKPIFYYEHEDSCMNTDEDHCAERHVEFDLGEYYCEDLPTGEKTCDSCCDDEGERVAYPCATVRAIEGAINGE